MNIIYANDRGVLEIGYAGEMDRTEVRFFYGDLEEEFPGGTVLLQVKRPNEDTKYDLLLPATDGEEHTASWIVSEYDCGIRGIGECQLVYTTGDVIAKRKIWRTNVNRSIEGSDASIPPDWEDIETSLLTAAGKIFSTIDTVRELVEDAHSAAQASAQAASKSAESAQEAQQATQEALEAVTGYRDEVVQITAGVTAEGERQVAAVQATGADRIQQVQDAITDTGADQITAVENAGTEQIGNVNSAADAKIGVINTAVSAHIAAIDQAGNAKVAAITDEGDAQIAAVEAKGAETLADIPETYTELNNAVEALQEDLAGFVNSVELRETEEGSMLVVTDGDGNETPIPIVTNGMAFNGGYVDSENYLHLTMDGDDVEDFTPFVLPAGGGGGGGGAGYVTITRITDVSVDCVYGNSMPIRFNFSATDSSGDTVGNGTGTWSVGGVVVARNVVVRQGDNSFDISPYLTSGNNSIRLQVSVDTGGNLPQTATKTWTVNAVDVYFTWNYDDAQINTDSFTDRWTPYGDIEKTTNTLIDGADLYTSTTSRSGVQQSMAIPMLSHGSHSVERWVSAIVGGEEQSTPRQYHRMIFAESGNMTTIVSISMPDVTINQYDTIQIPVVIYDPSSLTADASLRIDGTETGTWTDVDRSVHYWNYTPTASGAHVLSITCGDTTETITVTANAVEIDAEEIGGYSFRFKASDLATNNAVRNWRSNGVNATFSDNFDWINGGLHTETDSRGALQQYLLIKAGTRMTINHKMFATDPKAAGMNYKIIFKVGNVRNYDAQIGHCYADGVGLRMYAHQSVFNSSGTSISVPYGEDEYIELEFDVYPAPRVENDGNFRYIMAWIDGVITTCRVYGANDNFVQSLVNQEGIVLGSDDCDIYIYMVKAYPMLITRNDHIDNFIMDAPNAVEMMRRYNRNDILDESGAISYEKLMAKNPDCRVWVYDIPYLTNGKKDKVKNCQFHQFWPNGDAYYDITGTCTMTVQGTSSVKYILGAANTDENFTSLTDGRGKDLLENGTQDEDYGNNWFTEDPENPGHAKVYTEAEARTEAGIGNSDALGPEWVVVERDPSRKPIRYIRALGLKLNDNSCPITYSNTKVNFASCEQVNNMCNAAWYQRYNPYPSLTARDCMEFNMGVQFIKDSGSVPDDSHFVLWGDNKYHMYSIANMGNSKKNVHVFHDLSNPNEVCIEVNDNDKDQMRMVSDDLSSEDWSGDVFFGMRYPDTKNPKQEVRDAWQRLVSWMASRNPNAATGSLLVEAETYLPYTFRGHDRTGTQVLRGTTVSQYAGTYTHDTFERRMAKMLSECEDYMVMDSFMYHYCFIERHTNVDNVSKNTFWSSTDLQHWDLSKAYDMDTSDGNNNQGQMVFDYGNEYNDDIGGMKVFNAADSVWFIFCANLYEAARTMFTNREAAGAWSATAYHEFLLSEQQKIPERCWVECYWYDYLRTYEQGISTEWMTFLDGGQKTHQRKHYEFFQELYDSSKYRGTVSTSQNVNFRAYTPNTWKNYVSAENGAQVYRGPNESSGLLYTLAKGTEVTVSERTDAAWRKILISGAECYIRKENLTGMEPNGEITITMYNKMYISMDVGTTALAPIKAARATPVTIDFSSGGMLNNTLIAINTASMIQAISGLEQLYPDTCVFSAATRLRELKIGSEEQGYENTFLRSLALDNNRMLERLEVQNLPNASSVLDLTHCPALLTVDAGGSGFTGYEFADGGLLEEAILERPVSLVLQNLAYLTDEHFSVADWTALTTLRHENTPGIDSLVIVNAANALQIARILGLEWELPSSTLLTRMYGMQGLDENNYTTERSVLTGIASVPTISTRNQALFNDAWPGLTIEAATIIPQHPVTFVNLNGEPIYDKLGYPYIQYVDVGSEPYDPVLAGEVNAPTMATDAKYVYTYNGWTGLSGSVIEPRTVTAAYIMTLRTFRVRWGAQVGDIRKTLTDVPYGSCVAYDDNDPNAYPDLIDESGAFTYLALGWNKSTGYITEDTDVYVIWDRATLPASGTSLENMTMAQIEAVAEAGLADDYFEPKDHFDFELGRNYQFDNVESIELVSEPTFFDGTTAPIVFNGQNDKPLIQLFNGTHDRWTIALDFEFTSDAGTLLSCFNDNGNAGFQIRRSGNFVNALWGNVNFNHGYQYQRGIVVIRYNKEIAEDRLYIAYDGNTQANVYPTTPTSLASNVDESALTRSVYTETNAPLTIGSVGYLDGSDVTSLRGTGWVHWAKVWFDDIGYINAKAMAAFPHIPQRYNFTGIKYRKALDSADTVNAGFMSEGPLPMLKQMNTTSTTAGGWDAAMLRDWMNGQYFDALPVPVQQMILKARVRATAGDRSTDIINSMDKVYLAAYLEAFPGTTATYVDELDDAGRSIPYFAADTGRGLIANHLRVKFPGFILPDDANIIVNTSDPTTLSGNQYKCYSGKTVWYPASGTGTADAYIYVDAEWLSKHKHGSGRLVTANENKDALGTDGNGNTGGKWLRAYVWWLRSPYLGYTGYFWIVSTSGAANFNGAANYSYALVPAYSI